MTVKFRVAQFSVRFIREIKEKFELHSRGVSRQPKCLSQKWIRGLQLVALLLYNKKLVG